MSWMESAGLIVLVAFLLGAWWLLRTRRSTERRLASIPQDAYALGLSALIGGDRREALRRLKEAVQGDSTNLDAYIRLGDLLRESGDIQKALAIHRDLTVRAELADMDRARILESLTRDYFAAGRYEEAGQSAERLLRLHRTNRFAYRAVQQVAEALKDWPRAIRIVEERTRLEGEGGKPLLARYHGFVGAQEFAAGNVKEARRQMEEALKLDSRCLLAYLSLGDMDQAEGHTERAIERWRSLARIAPEHASLVFDRLERAYFELGRFEEVVAFYRELLEGAPRESSAPALLALAEIYRRKGDLDQAESFVQDALERSPEQPRAYRHLAKIALDRHDLKGALTHVDRVLQALPVDAQEGQCRHCGNALKEPSWRCPHCHALDPQGL
jgi:lipopolysaccharide assembly protein B